jgi:hypothetical protein
MRREIRYAPNGVALYFDVGGVHLLDKRYEAPKFDNLDLVFGWATVSASRMNTILQSTYC